eukprot:2924449-Pleurochrysis_carterae.AAC.2
MSTAVSFLLSHSRASSLPPLSLTLSLPPPLSFCMTGACCFSSPARRSAACAQDASPVSSAQAAAACLPPFPHEANSDDDDDLRVDSDASSADASN